MDTTTRTNNSQLIGGLVLIAVGVLFLADRFWFFDAGRFFATWWPSVMIAFGVWMLVTRGRRAGMGPMFMILLGAFFQARRLDWIDWRMRDVWPAFLIAMGLWMLLERGRILGSTAPTK